MVLSASPQSVSCSLVGQVPVAPRDLAQCPELSLHIRVLGSSRQPSPARSWDPGSFWCSSPFRCRGVLSAPATVAGREVGHFGGPPCLLCFHSHHPLASAVCPADCPLFCACLTPSPPTSPLGACGTATASAHGMGSIRRHLCLGPDSLPA